jgi:hypothetical protein
MHTLVRFAALPLLFALAFATYAYASLYVAGYLFPRVVPRPYFEMMSTAVVGSSAAAAVSAWPLVRLYAGRAWLAALAIASPFMVIRTSDLIHYAGKNEPRIMVMSWFELLVYPAVLLAGVWVVATFSRKASTPTDSIASVKR